MGSVRFSLVRAQSPRLMKLIILGSGTAIAKKERRGPSFLLETGSQKLLFDCGWGCLLGLLESGIEAGDIDQIFISHSHADHLANLIPLLQSILVTQAFFPQKSRKKDLIIHGYKGFKNDYEVLRKIMFPERSESYKIEIHEHDNGEEIIDNIEIKTTTVNHVPQYFPSVAYRINSEGRSFTYSGDCNYNENIINLAQKSDLLLLDCSVPVESFQKHGPFPTHLSPFEAGEIANKSEVKTLVLFHLYDISTSEEIKKEIGKNYSGDLIIPSDLQQISL